MIAPQVGAGSRRRVAGSVQLVAQLRRAALQHAREVQHAAARRRPALLQHRAPGGRPACKTIQSWDIRTTCLQAQGLVKRYDGGWKISTQAARYTAMLRCLSRRSAAGPSVAWCAGVIPAYVGASTSEALTRGNSEAQHLLCSSRGLMNYLAAGLIPAAGVRPSPRIKTRRLQENEDMMTRMGFAHTNVSCSPCSNRTRRHEEHVHVGSWRDLAALCASARAENNDRKNLRRACALALHRRRPRLCRLLLQHCRAAAGR